MLFSGFKHKVAVVLAPHADEEILGAGGFICRAAAAGWDPNLLFATVSGYSSLQRGDRCADESRIAEDASDERERRTKLCFLQPVRRRSHLRLDCVPHVELISFVEAYLKASRPSIAVVPCRAHGRPFGITESELQAWNAEGVVSWIGHSTNVPALLARAHFVCLPSYVDGLPLSLAEAAGPGRPIVASDTPGCRAVVRDQANGFLVVVRDSEALAEHMAKLLANRELRQRMGAAGRDFAVRELSIEHVIGHTFAVYRRLGLDVATRNLAVARPHSDAEPVAR